MFNWKSLFIWKAIFVFVFLISGCIICSVMAILTPLFYINRKFYRKICGKLAILIWCQYTFLAQWWSRGEIELYCTKDVSKILGHENLIVVMNHKYDIDWLMGWVLTLQAGVLPGSKIIGKASLKLVPVMGWIWTFCESIFLKRRWKEDQQTLENNLEQLSNYPNDCYYNVLLFCEGTRFTDSKHIVSEKKAEEKGLQPLKHHLQPRPRGFFLLMNQGKSFIPVIYDLTIGLDRNHGKHTLMSVLDGDKHVAKFLIRRIPSTNIPTEDIDVFTVWLNNLYQDKDKIYDHFDRTGNFPDSFKDEEYHRHQFKPSKIDLYIEIFWVLLCFIPIVYYLLTISMTSGQFITMISILIISLIFLQYMLHSLTSVTKKDLGTLFPKDQKSSQSNVVEGDSNKQSEKYSKEIPISDNSRKAWGDLIGKIEDEKSEVVSEKNSKYDDKEESEEEIKKNLKKRTIRKE